jgi:flagellar basal-body rod protein FlgC
VCGLIIIEGGMDMSSFSGMNVSASGMTAQRLRMDIISQNIANINTTRDEFGNVYKRQSVVFAEKDVTAFKDVLMKTAGTMGNGVKVTKIVEDDKTPLRKVYDPAHPDADQDGYVSYPNVNTVQEMTDLIDATRSYEANVTAFNAAKNIALKGLEIGK